MLKILVVIVFLAIAAIFLVPVAVTAGKRVMRQFTTMWDEVDESESVQD